MVPERRNISASIAKADSQHLKLWVAIVVRLIKGKASPILRRKRQEMRELQQEPSLNKLRKSIDIDMVLDYMTDPYSTKSRMSSWLNKKMLS